MKSNREFVIKREIEQKESQKIKKYISKLRV